MVSTSYIDAGEPVQHSSDNPSQGAAVVYERRIDGKRGFDLEAVSHAQIARVGKSFMTYWREDLLAHLSRGDINVTDYGVGQALASFSDGAGKMVWPSQETIGKMVDRRPRTVRRSLKRLRALGLLEWGHRFLKPRRNEPLARATTNLYAFRLSDGWVDTQLEERLARTNDAKARSQKSRWRATGRVTPKKQKGLSEFDSTVVATVRIAEFDFDTALAEIQSLTHIDDAETQFRELWPRLRE